MVVKTVSPSTLVCVSDERVLSVDSISASSMATISRAGPVVMQWWGDGKKYTNLDKAYSLVKHLCMSLTSSIWVVPLCST